MKTGYVVRGISRKPQIITPFDIDENKIELIPQSPELNGCELYVYYTDGKDSHDGKIQLLYKCTYGNYLVVNPNFGTKIDEGGVGCKSWYDQLISFKTNDQEVYSASLLIDDKNLEQKPYCVNYYGIAFGIEINQENFCIGSELEDFYSGIYSRNPIALAPAGVLQNYVKDRDQAELKEVNIVTIQVDKNDFDKYIAETFKDGHAKLEILHDTGMNIIRKSINYFTDLEKMIEHGVPGEVLIHKMHLNKAPFEIILPNVYEMDFKETEEMNVNDDILAAESLKEFAERFTDRKVSFAVWNVKYEIIKVDLIINDNEKFVIKRQQVDRESPSVSTQVLEAQVVSSHSNESTASSFN